MSKRSELWTLLLKREGEWLTRDELEFVGGAEAMRRLREIRTQAFRAGYDVEEQSLPGAPSRWRLVKTGRDVEAMPRCTKCGLPPSGTTQSTMDARWVIGWCPRCDDKKAIFRVPMTQKPAPPAITPVEDSYVEELGGDRLIEDGDLPVPPDYPGYPPVEAQR